MKVIKIKEQKDGSAIYTIAYDKKEEAMIKKYYGVKKVTKKLFSKFVLTGIENYLEGKNESSN